MKLKRNSIWSLIYKLFYGTNKIPDNLSYFSRKQVIAILFIIPVIIITLPYILYHIDQIKNDDYEIYGDITFMGRIFIGITIWFIIFFYIAVVVYSISIFFVGILSGIHFICQIGSFVLVFGLLFNIILERIRYVRIKRDGYIKIKKGDL